MKVISGTGDFPQKFRNPVLAIGVFDGLHLGHQKLIQRMILKAKSIHGTSMLMTFHPHPVHVLHPQIKLPLIISFPFRLKLIEDLGVDVCCVIHFTKKFAQLSPQTFIKNYLVDKIGIKEVFVGEDFRFGQNRLGTLKLFEEAAQKFGFKVNAVHAVMGKHHKISSTDIRQFILDGQLNKAKRLLGRSVSLMGVVIHGDSRGKSLGFPTANISFANEIIPPLGVYAVYVIIAGQKFKAMANIGYRPSFKTNNKRVNIEAHIFNFRKNIYGKQIIIGFLQKIRDEKVFPTESHLIIQLRKDKMSALKIFKTSKV